MTNAQINTLNSVLTILGFIIGIIPLIFTAISLRSKKPIFYKKSFTLSADLNKYTSDPTQLQVLYQSDPSKPSKPIKVFTITRILFYNSGKEVIDKSDIASKEPLKIVCDSKLIKANVIFF